jgi:hypothetical protein
MTANSRNGFLVQHRVKSWILHEFPALALADCDVTFLPIRCGILDRKSYP